MSWLHTWAVSDASVAIGAVCSDPTVPLNLVLRSLKTLRDKLDVLIDTFEEDARRWKGGGDAEREN